MKKSLSVFLLVGALTIFVFQGLAYSQEGLIDQDSIWPQLIDQDGGSARGVIKEFFKGQIQHRRELRKKLNLTAEQKERLKEVIKKHKQENQNLIEDAIAGKRELREAVLSDNSNEQVIRQAADRLHLVMAEASVAASRMLQEAKEILTQEQKDLIREFIQTRDKAIDKARERFNSRN